MMKLMNRHHILLTVCALILVLICYLSVSAPMRFEEQVKEREKIVEYRMNSIQQAETQYLRTHGYYTASLDSLVKEGLLADSLRFIPFSDDVMFSIQTSMEPLESGETVPQMSCSASYRDYLNGMNEKEIDNLIRRASEEGKFPGLIIGNVNP